MRSPASPLRLFVAVYPPAVVVQCLLDRVRGLVLPPCRLTAPSQVHLTIQFVGPVPVKMLDQTVESVRRACAGCQGFELATGPLIRLPAVDPRRRALARVLAVELAASRSLWELKSRLVARLARGARVDGADRFLPHVTLARFPGAGVRPGAEFEPATRSAEAPDSPESLRWRVEEVFVMRSRLQPDGALHDIVEVVPLPSSSV